MGEPTAGLREGLQEARVAALQGREEIRQQNYKAPRRAAGRHRLLYVVVFNSLSKLYTLALHFTNSAASTSLKCFTVFTLSSTRVTVLFGLLVYCSNFSQYARIPASLYAAFTETRPGCRAAKRQNMRWRRPITTRSENSSGFTPRCRR